MPTNDERKRVADALMFLTLRPSMSKRGEHADLCRACGCEGATWRDLFLRLADLIDPGEGQNEPDASTDADRGTRVDREALLALADEMGRYAPHESGCARKTVALVRAEMAGYARRIRETLGEAAGEGA